MLDHPANSRRTAHDTAEVLNSAILSLLGGAFFGEKSTPDGAPSHEPDHRMAMGEFCLRSEETLGPIQWYSE